MFIVQSNNWYMFITQKKRHFVIFVKILPNRFEIVLKFDCLLLSYWGNSVSSLNMLNQKEIQQI